MFKINIFLVDSNDFYLKNLEVCFGSKPYYNIKTFSNGEQCLENLSLNPDIIILDYFLNSVVKDAMDGLETLIRIRAINPLVPVVILSSEEDMVVKANCIMNNATEFIVKGDISIAKLREVITKIFLDKTTKEDLLFRLNKAIYFDQ